MMTAYTIDALVQDLRKVVAEHDDPRAVLQQAAPMASRMKDDKGWVRPEFYECGEDQGFGITVLHEEPDHSLLVLSRLRSGLSTHLCGLSFECQGAFAIQ